MGKCVFDRGEECSALYDKICDKCGFRKSQKELFEGRMKAMDILSNQPDGLRKVFKYHETGIYDVYLGWKEGKDAVQETAGDTAKE